MKNKILYLAILSIMAACTGGGNEKAEKEAEVPGRKPSIYGFFPEDYRIDSSHIRSGETFGTLMLRLGLSAKTVYDLTRMCDTTFDVRRIRAGNSFEAFYTKDSLPAMEYMVYHHNMVRSTVFHCKDSLYIANIEKPTVKERRYADVTIKESLWNDMLKAGASPLLISELADIYQWSVNFFGLQENDRFQVIYSQSLCEGKVFNIDTVHFCLFTSGKYQVPALYYDIGKGRTYWGDNGESLRKMFLKAPLKYNRISSRFTYARKHPITGRVRPHTAVDYAAPKGTPVHSIGEGKVTLCGWDSHGGGNRIKIKHAQGYESCYMHLSKFAKGIHAGSLVHQGDLIGYVGSTGHSTGPHLDFRIWLKGKPIDPLKLNSPSSEPLGKKYLEDFRRRYDILKSEMDSLSLYSNGKTGKTVEQ